MRYLVVLFWAVILGNVASYIGGSLNHGSYNPSLTTGIVLVTGIIIMLIGQVAQPSKVKEQKK